MSIFCIRKLSIFLLLTLYSQCTSSFSLPNNPQSHSNPLLFGDAKLITGAGGSSSAVKLTDFNPQTPSPSSSGLLVWAKPIKFLSANPVSFSADFTFSIASDNAVGLAFVIMPTDFPSKFLREGPKQSRSFRVEFGTLVDGNGNAKKFVGVSVKSLVPSKVSNVSKTSSVLSDWSKLHSWIDYDSSSKRLEIRLGEFGLAKPYAPLLACGVDLAGMWKNEEVLMALSSTSGKHLQSTVVHSWNQSTVVYSWNQTVRKVPKSLHSQPVNPDLFSDEGGRTRNVPKWLHSEPVNPQLFSNERGEKEKRETKKRSCILGFLSGLIFVTGCAALAAFVILSLWAILTRNEEVVIPAKCLVHPGDVRYKKIDVVVEDRTDVKS